MKKAIWNNMVLADSDETIIVEGNHYFPPESVNWKFLNESNTNTTCFWKGRASYNHIQVNGNLNKDAAWYYPEPSEAVKQIKDYVAFWKGVQIEG